MYFLDVDCTGLMPVIKFIKKGVIPIIQIGIPILLIIFGMLDLGKAVVAGKEDEIKKNQQMLVKRAISAVAIFFVVTLVTFVFSIFSETAEGVDVPEGQGGFMQCWTDA